MRAIIVLLLAVSTLVGATGAVAAADGADQPTQTPTGPGDETPTDESNTTTGVSPGQQLAGAVGAQGASLQDELWNRTLTERLANATTAAGRAEVVSDEVAILEAYLAELRSARENLTESWNSDDLSEGRYRNSLSEFVIRARTVERRANQTARAAENLPTATRESHGIDVSYIRSLGERANELYQFENEIAREVTNETLAGENQWLPPSGTTERADGPRQTPE